MQRGAGRYSSSSLRRYPSSSHPSFKLSSVGDLAILDNDGCNTMSAHALAQHIRAKQLAPLPGVALTRPPNKSRQQRAQLHRSASPRSHGGAVCTCGNGSPSPRALQLPQLRSLPSPGGGALKPSGSSGPKLSKLSTLPEVPRPAEGS